MLHSKIDNINTAMSVCLENGIKVYPIISYGRFRIQVSVNGRKYPPYRKELLSDDVNNAMTKTYMLFAAKIKDNKL